MVSKTSNDRASAKEASRFRSSLLVLGLALAAGLALASCATKPPVLPEDASAAEIIQKAQERSDLYDWKGAKYCYQLLLERFPQDKNIVITAMYELAFIEYKQGHKERAAEGFKAVIAAYSAGGGESLPATWKILSEKLLAKLEPPPAQK
ncbi:MAG TPA: hypothetical protein VIO60_05705 [Rectinemataceae bacterium]